MMKQLYDKSYTEEHKYKFVIPKRTFLSLLTLFTNAPVHAKDPPMV